MLIGMETNLASPTRERMVELAQQYFRLVDGEEGSLPGMFTDDARVFFPKYGTARGPGQFAELAGGLLRSQKFFRHDVDTMVFTAEGSRLVVEGLEAGEAADGRPWPAHPRSEGRYCNVFEFAGELITRLHIYADPDFLTEDTDRLRWD
ncbi:nuclear transport factor 2 family protein [Aeromicrobium chenweiae]|uniref:Nuclear transport factor 2 family protein n=3 Tax=Aeromicrobium chenweiae TaxID=2079793 RepID=A0A2S0WLQ5_9ACTN|nr:nuclear transport factor 2 family protein [Aeromicrobium chenweiae]